MGEAPAEVAMSLTFLFGLADTGIMIQDQVRTYYISHHLSGVVQHGCSFEAISHRVNRKFRVLNLVLTYNRKSRNCNASGISLYGPSLRLPKA